MTHPKPSNSSLRYFLAGLKPLANIKVWGSVGLIGLVALFLWQYSRHPEWLGADGPPNQTFDGEFEAEVGNNLDIGVTLQDAKKNNINPSGIPQNSLPTPQSPLNDPQNTKRPTPPMLSDPFLDPPSVPKEFKNPKKQPSVGFQPLMPSFDDIGSLFPPLKPSKNASKPIKIPDTVLEAPNPQANPLQEALDNLDSSPATLAAPSTSENNQPERIPVRPAQPSYPTTTNPRGNTYGNPTYPQPYNPSVPNNVPPRPQTPYANNQPYNPQPYSYPYGNGVAPAPMPAYPSSQPSYGERIPNANNPTGGNQAPPANNYGIQPPQVDGNQGFGYY
ncbi:MAG: hypothetical protein AB4062_11590 [Crocosphaera sp.]